MFSWVSPVTGSYTTCRVDFVFPRRRLTHLCCKPHAFSLVAAHMRSEAASQGKTAVATVVSDQTDYQFDKLHRRPDETVTALAVCLGCAATFLAKTTPFVNR